MRKSYFHRGGAESLLGVTIPDRLAEIVAKFPKREAVVSVAQGVRLTYSELAARVDEAGAGAPRSRPRSG